MGTVSTAEHLAAIRAFLESVEPGPTGHALRAAALVGLREIETIVHGEAAVTRICRSCDGAFTLSSDEVIFYSTQTDKRGEPYKLPKRCSRCRSNHHVRRGVKAGSPTP